MKILTFSLDDGNTEDLRLVEQMNRYGLKGTFHLNAGRLSFADWWPLNENQAVHHLNALSCPELYAGHEVAGHTLTHKDLTRLDPETACNEIALDQLFLQALYGMPVTGFAYPYGAHNAAVRQMLAGRGFTHARTARSSGSFAWPADFLQWDPTCTFNSTQAFRLAEQFVRLPAEEDALFCLWGHSYELVAPEDWEKTERLFDCLAGREDIIYATMRETVRLCTRAGSSGPG